MLRREALLRAGRAGPLLIAAALVLAGCGGDGDSGPSIVSPVSQGKVIAYPVAVSAIDATIDARYGSVRAYLATGGATRPQLFVFLPASPLTPNDYRLVAEGAAAAGLYSVALPYPNTRSVNSACNGSADVQCHGHVRQALLAGGDVPQALPALSVSTSDSIANRLAKTLAFLAKTYPTAGWAQFLDAGGNVLWSKVRLGGHGEGGSQAAYIATQRSLVQACLLSAPGDVANGVPAPWIGAAATSSATPGGQWVAFTHVQDAVTTLASLQAAWTALGLTGTPTSVDDGTPPYAGSHLLTSRLVPSGVNDFHSISAVDAYTPLNADGTPTYAPVWTAACF